MRLKRALVCGAIAAAISAANANAQPAPRNATAEFVSTAALSDEFERREGRLAATHGSSPEVRRFGAEMVMAHTRTTAALKSAVRRAHMAPPPRPQLTADQMSRIEALEVMHGGTFDRAYIDQQVNAHQHTLDVVTAYAEGGPPGPIRAAARKTAPLVQHHLDMAKKIRSNLGPGL